MKSFIIILKNNSISEGYGNNALASAERFGWNIEKFDGIYGNSESLKNYNVFPTIKSKKCNREFQKAGVIGCFLSHYNLWLKCLEINEPIGIFEHDVLFLSPPLKEFNFAEILRLDKLSQGKDHGTGLWWEGSHGYLLTPSGANKLINLVKDYGAWPVDVMIGTNIVNIKFDDNNLICLDQSSKNNSLTRNINF